MAQRVLMIEAVDRGIDAIRAQGAPALGAQHADDLAGRQPVAIRPCGRERIDDVGDGEDARGLADGRAREATEIPRPIEPLVVTTRVVGKLAEHRYAIEDLEGELR